MHDNPLFSPKIRSNGCDGLYSLPVIYNRALDINHRHLNELPDWAEETIATLCTDRGPHAIPITAPLRIADRKILFALKRDRGSLERLRNFPLVALLILGKGDLAFTASGRATIVQEPMLRAPGFAAVSIDVETIDDHRLKGRAVACGAELDWDDPCTKRFLRAHIDALREIAAGMLSSTEQ